MIGSSPTDAAKRLLLSALLYARARLEIFEAQATEERQRLIDLVKACLATAVGSLIALQLVATMVLALTWDTPWRVHAIAGMIGVAAILIGLAWSRLVALSRPPPPRPITEVLEDIDRFADAEQS